MQKLLSKKCLYAGLLPSPEIIENYFRGHGIDLVKSIGPNSSADHLASLIKNVDGVLAGGEPYSASVIESSPRLRIIARAGVGYDKVDIESATKNGTYVTITPIPELSAAVAEQSFALILSLLKKVPEMNIELRKGIWNSRGWWDYVGDLYHSTLGLLGVGRIGSEVAKRAKAFQMRVIYYDSIRRTDLEKSLGIEFVSYEKLLELSDILSIHVPLNQETRGMINENTFQKMKRTAILVNTARGAIVEEKSLSTALTEGRIAAAGIDVFSEEPPSPSHPFHKLESNIPNLIVTEHSISMHTVMAMITSAAEEVVRVFSGDLPKYPVNQPAYRR